MLDHLPDRPLIYISVWFARTAAEGS